LGLASEEERREFERLCLQYPELTEARNEFELALQNQAMENAVQPPVDCKEKIWSAIQQSPASNPSKLITMEPTISRRSTGMAWVAAASILLFLATGYFAYHFYSQRNDLENSTKLMEARIREKDSILSKIREQERIMHDPDVTVINMTAMTPSAPSANVYWDTTSSDVYLVVKNMPRLASGKQYQLWSLLNSDPKNPTSLGLFDGGEEKLILKMNNARKADAFAITIEKRGNTDGPDLSQLQVMGKTKL
jgi:hypothetical protein